MERLTKWIDDGEKRQAIPDPEEQGLLLRLPYRESEEQSEKRSSKMPEAMVDFIRRRFMTRQ